MAAPQSLLDILTPPGELWGHPGILHRVVFSVSQMPGDSVPPLILNVPCGYHLWGKFSQSRTPAVVLGLRLLQWRGAFLIAPSLLWGMAQGSGLASAQC